MKILIILTRFNADPYIYNPSERGKNYSYLMPMGLGYISSVLKAAAYEVDVLNLNHLEGTAKEEITNHLRKNFYNLILLGGVSIYFPNIRDYVKWIREVSPESKIVVGGGLISAQPELMMNLIRPDFAVIGEGEETCVDLARAVNFQVDPYFVKGIAYWKEGKITFTGKREPIIDLDKLPYPDFDAFGFSEFLNNIKPDYIAYDAFDFPRAYPILASRSCPFSCTFCYHTIGNKYRQRSIDNVIKEIRYALDKYYINVFFFYDELFAYDRERALEFCRKFRQVQNETAWNVVLNLNMRVDCLDDEILDALKDIECNPVGLGLESYSSTILKSMRKHTTPEQIKAAIYGVEKRGLSVQGSFIFGDPEETLETAKETVDFYMQNQDYIGGGVRLGFIIPFQGSPVYKRLVNEFHIPDEVAFIEARVKNGYLFHEPMNLTRLSDNDFDRLKDMVFTANYVAGKFAVPFGDEYKRIGKIVVNCPHCGEQNVYSNMTYPEKMRMKSVGCRECGKRFNMVTPYFLIVQWFIKTFGFMRVYRVKKMLSLFG